LFAAKLQGAYFYNTYSDGVSYKSISNLPLRKKDAEKLIKIVKTVKYSPSKGIRDNIKKLIIKSINSAIDKEPKVWIKKQNILTGKLEKICKELNDGRTKESLGCDKIK
jgi:hypothetical protein